MKTLRMLPWVLAAVAGGLIASGSSLSAGLPEIDKAHMWWHMGRASGFAAYGLLFLSVVLGIAISSRVFDGMLARPWVFDTHQFLSIYVLVAMLFHALIMLPDPYAHFRLWELLVPFATEYRPLAVGAGAIVLYGSAIVSISFYLKRFIGQRAWRWLHYSTFALFIVGMVHGIYAGTDSREQWAQYTYLSTGLAVLFFTFFRILAAKRIQTKNAPAVPSAGAIAASTRAA